MPTKRRRAASGTPPPRPDLPDKGFATRAALRTWLDRNHATSPGLWLLVAKKHSGHRSVTYPEAVEEGLCFGWIDGQAKTSDRYGFFRVRFVRRSPRSVWSKRNQERVLALTAVGLMRPAGQAAVDAAKANGQWDRAYGGVATATVPDDLARALQASPRARDFFATLDRTNRYAVLWRVQTAATPATRARRIATLVEQLARGERIHRPATVRKAASSTRRAASPRRQAR